MPRVRPSHAATVLALTASSASAQIDWTPISPATSPVARQWHAMAFDSVRRVTVLYGGKSLTSNTAADTWLYDGTAWTQATPPIAPPGRTLHAMAFDAVRGLVVLFGGLGSQYWGDTWTFDGSNWSLVTTITTFPAARFQHAMAYDPLSDRVVLFGGATQQGTVGDHWTFDGVDWTPQPNAAAAPRSSHRMVHDTPNARLLMIGGAHSGSYFGTWAFQGGSWSALTPATPLPRRGDFAAVFDSARGRVVVQGGSGPTGLRNDTWEFDGQDWQQITTPAALAQFPRNSHAMAFDSHRGESVMFGGGTFGPFPLGDTWEFGPVVAGTASPYGIGCGNPALGLQPDPAAPPVIGTTAAATILDAPNAALTGLVAGFDNTTLGTLPLPLDLGQYGMPGCQLFTSSEIAPGLGSATPLTATTARFELALPNTPAFVGLPIYLQAFALAPGANPLQLIVSNGLAWTVGEV